MSISSNSSDKKSHSSITAEVTHTGIDSRILATDETRAVKFSKAVVLLILGVAASGVGVTTYKLLEYEEQKAFKSQFLAYSKEVTEMSSFQAESVFKAIDALAADITSYAIDSDIVWPFITVPHFETRGLHFNDMARSHIVGFSPAVSNNETEPWEKYSIKKKGWIQEGFNLHEDEASPIIVNKNISESIYSLENEENERTQFLPAWQISPPPFDASIVNLDLLSNSLFHETYHRVIATRHSVCSPVGNLEWLYNSSFIHQTREDHPHNIVLAPIFGEFHEGHEWKHTGSEHEAKGVAYAVLPWTYYFLHLLSEGANGFVIVLDWQCQEASNDESFHTYGNYMTTFTYEIDGPAAHFLGYGDLHDERYADMMVHTKFATFSSMYDMPQEECGYGMRMYPSKKLENIFHTKKPAFYTSMVLLVFFCTTLVFVVYDIMVERRQNKVMHTAVRANTIVNSIFPSNVRDRIMEDVEERAQTENNPQGPLVGPVPKRQLKNFLDNGQNKNEKKDNTFVYESKPIADLFPSATIFFGDIVGFTAWSSEREPLQVFQLLETIYHGFDEITTRRHIFKVETVGDCYVAVAGLPETRKDHAVIMCRAAREYLIKISELTKQLEVVLGPGTGDLTMRIGIHSGPVTAGVLRGQNSRFQLFGDTINTASRMESNGLARKIQISSATANLLLQAGKSHWFRPRKEKVKAKGKGEMQTYILELDPRSSSLSASTSSAQKEESCLRLQDRCGNLSTCKSNERVLLQSMSDLAEASSLSPSDKRLVDWSSKLLIQYLKRIVARRDAINTHMQKSARKANTSSAGGPQMNMASSCASVQAIGNGVQLPIDEVHEIIEMPIFDPDVVCLQDDVKNIDLDGEVVKQVHEFMYTIALMYRGNPFHNFEHASHVTMSVVKLLSRIIAPDEIVHTTDGIDESAEQLVRSLHDHTYGIISDPLTQFAVVFSALVHDVDHTGLPNAQLVKEKTPLAIYYKNKSIAEQNSVDLAWKVLMDERFSKFRSVLCATDEESVRLRQLVVNVVMATDIVDKELKQLRNDRWERAFSPQQDEEETQGGTPTKYDADRKATIVLEHLIQASDVAHTMQHWHIYLKWNEKFFLENLVAYRTGMSQEHPGEYWYNGEVGFFDFYIIPLAKKLKECGVFGVSSNEYLQYAIDNMKEWEMKGQEVVAGWVEKYDTKGQLPAVTQSGGKVDVFQ